MENTNNQEEKNEFEEDKQEHSFSGIMTFTAL